MVGALTAKVVVERTAAQEEVVANLHQRSQINHPELVPLFASVSKKTPRSWDSWHESVDQSSDKSRTSIVI